MRKHPRYPVSMDAVIVGPQGERIPGYITDLSTGGAGIETVHAVPRSLERFTLLVMEPSLHMKVECEVRSVRELWRKRVIHAQFVGAEHRAPVDNVIRQVQEAASNLTPFPAARVTPLERVRRLFGRRVA
jgi:hypothetical protein